MNFNTGSRDTGWLATLLYGVPQPGQPLAATGARIAQLVRQGLALVLSALMIMVPMGQEAFAQEPAAPAPPPASDQQAPQAQPLTPDQLNQLVAPIALYPDALVAQVLAAATYPTQVVEADRWRQAQGNAPAEQIAAGADGQNWDPSVKALTAFPTVLEQMDKNLQWTTDLGNAYYNQPQDIMDSVQGMRQKAQNAGQLRSTPQQTVTTTPGQPITIVPANPTVVYVPTYDPWAVYGYPFAPYPGFFYSPWGGIGIGFGIGIGIGLWGGWGWGWGHWGVGWHSRGVFFNHGAYFTHSTTVMNRGLNRPGGPGRGFGARGAYARPGGGAGYGRAGAMNRGSMAGRPGGMSASRPGGNAARPGGMSSRPGGMSARPGGAPGGMSAARPGGAAGGASRPAAAARSASPGASHAGSTGHSGGGAARGGGGGHAGGGGHGGGHGK